MTWTHFHDMHSGGRLKLKWHHIFIEAPEGQARTHFERRFGRDPDNVTCECCGADYSVSEEPSLRRATAFNRGCRHLKTPRGPDGRYQRIDDPEFHENYYLEADQQPPPGYEVDTVFSSWNEYQTVEEYAKRDDVLVLYAADLAKEAS